MRSDLRPVQLVAGDVAVNGCGDQITNGQTVTKPITQCRGGDVEITEPLKDDLISRAVLQCPYVATIAKLATHGNGERGAQRGCTHRRSRGHDQIAQREDAAIILPRRDLTKGVDTENKGEVCTRLVCPQRAQRVHREGPSGALDLNRRDAEAWVAGDRQAHHRETMRCGDQAVGSLVWRRRAGNEEDAVEPLGFAHLFGAAQMTDM